MTQTTPKQKQYRAVLAVIVISALAACSPVASGSWYDSDKAGEKPSQAKVEKPKNKKPEPEAAESGGGFADMLANMRARLDRRAEAQKQRDRKKRERIYGKSDAAPKSNSKQTTSTKSSDGLVTVKKGETYYSLARRYNVPVRALLTANKARPPYVLSPGDRITIPQQQFYAVQKKDTLYSISRAHKTDVASLAKLNGLKRPYTISVGQRLQIPGQVKGQGNSARAALPVTQSQKSATTKTAKRVLPQAPKRVGRFRVPVQGPVISNFGPKEGGLHNDGINISARKGAPIVAAENGVVVYTGNELRGYGNLLLIRHSGGWVTAYAHISKFRVQPGTRVKQGDVIAEVGQTGNVERPQLHFELRKGTRAVNPQSLI